jgi:N-acyl-D-aspartate/D-glutamate deacylase
VQTRPIDISFSFLRPSLYFGRLPRWMRILRLPLAERLAALNDPVTVGKMVADADTSRMSVGMATLTVRGGDAAPADYAGRTLGDIAKERGESVAQALIAISLEGGLDVALLAANQGHNITDRVGALLAHPHVHIGASDGGAHITSFSTYGDTGFLFSEFVRHGSHLTLEQAVKKITSDTAEIWGLKNRGRIAEGFAADIVVFDSKTIGRGEEHAIFDMPGGGMRYVRDAIGVDTVLVNGQVAYADGEYQSAKAGIVCT